MNLLYILGRQPEFGLAELDQLYGESNVERFSKTTAVVNAESNVNFKRIGGSLKNGVILGQIDGSDLNKLTHFIEEEILKLSNSYSRKIILGISVYDSNIDVKTIERMSIKIKQLIRTTGKSVRVVIGKEASLSTAQVIHNKLTTKGIEVLIAYRNNSFLIAKTQDVQDINDYTLRDRYRPRRDAKVGMLPPKLAQIMINLINPPISATIYDPFCGTGVVLLEANLMGYNSYGSDLNPLMIEYAQANLDWAKKQYSFNTSFKTQSSDATSIKWSKEPKYVVSETYLGPALFNLPGNNRLLEIAREVNTITENFLKNLANQTTAHSRVCLAVPAWKTKDGFLHLQLLDHLEKIGYNHMSFNNVGASKLIYHRPQQIVAREILVLIRK